jgi:hypothetical protein
MAGERLGLPKELSQSNSSQEGSDGPENATSDDEAEVKFKPIPGARNPNGKGAKSPDPARDGSESSGGTEDFVVDDEDEGAAEGLDLPIQFSMSCAQPLGVSFKVFFQFLVHVACQPPHLREAYVKTRLSGKFSIFVEILQLTPSIGDNTTADYFKNAINHLRKTLGSIRDSQVKILCRNCPSYSYDVPRWLLRYGTLDFVRP